MSSDHQHLHPFPSSPNDIARTTMPTRLGPTFAWTSRATATTSSPALHATRRSICTNAINLPANGTAPASTNHQQRAALQGPFAMPTTTTAANVPTTSIKTPPTLPKKSAPPSQPVKRTLPPNSTHVLTEATTQNVLPVRRHSPPQHPAKPTICPPINVTRPSNARDLHLSPSQLAVSIRHHPPHHFYPDQPEMQNPSPYDSGYDSGFSTASGPGHPPSSRRNSNIDEQVSGTIHPRSTRDQYRQQHPASTNSPPSTRDTLPYHHPSISILQSQLTTVKWPTTPIPNIHPPYPGKRHRRG